MLSVMQLSLCCLCVTVLLRFALEDLVQIELIPGRLGLVEFYLHDGEKLISNQVIELEDQTSSMTFMQSDDRVVNLGANIGTTCILFEKLLRAQGGAAHTPHVACVEPNNLMQPILHDNFRLNEVTGIMLLDGLVADTPNCPEGVPISRGEAQTAARVEQFARLSRLPRSMKSWSKIYDTYFNISNCFTLQAIKERLGNKMTVIYADCEGCFTDVFRLNREVFVDPMVRLVMFEGDGDYTEVKKGLVELGFRMRKYVFASTGPSETWQRGPPYATVRVWAIMMWLMLTIVAKSVVDKLFLGLLSCWRVLPFYDTYVQVPVWRLLIIFFICSVRPVSQFGNAWVLYQGPSAFASDWKDLYLRAGDRNFLRHLFVYPCVVWHLVIRMQKTFMPTRRVNPWVLCLGFLCSTGLTGYLVAALKNHQPHNAIWDVTIVATMLLTIVMLFRERKLARLGVVTP